MTSLVAVRTALKAADTNETALLTALIDEGKLAPYKSKEIARQKLSSKGVEYPALGKKQVPRALRKRHSLKDLQQMCLRELAEMRECLGDRHTYFTQPDLSKVPKDTNLEDAGIQTIHSLTDPDLVATGTVVTFPSETLEKLCNEDWEEPVNFLACPITKCIVLPGNTLLPLHHSNEGTTITTLLAGSIVWVIWPPTDKNHRTLQTAYEDLAQGDESDIGLATDLEGGMIFVQKEGDGLRIPPFSLMMALATSTAVLATFSEVTVENFISRMQKLPLLKAWFQTELDGDRKQAEFNFVLLRTLGLLLNGVEDKDGDDDDEEPEFMALNHLKLPHAKVSPLQKLLRIWDDIKNDLVAMIGPANHETVENIWGDFLIDVPGRDCAICGRRIQNKAKLIKKHFVDSHWSTYQETKRKDSKEPLGKDQDNYKIAKHPLAAKADDGDGESAIELDDMAISA